MAELSIVNLTVVSSNRQVNIDPNVDPNVDQTSLCKVTSSVFFAQQKGILQRQASFVGVIESYLVAVQTTMIAVFCFFPFVWFNNLVSM